MTELLMSVRRTVSLICCFTGLRDGVRALRWRIRKLVNVAEPTPYI